jgi:hypothetical protein
VTAVWLLVRGDLRRRWRSWVVLGVLAGISVGLACAGIAGARRTDRAVPRFAQVSHLPDAAVLPNDPAFDETVRAQVAALPEVTGLYPFQVPFLLRVKGPDGMDSPLLPTTPASMRVGESPYVAGRAPDPARADEIAVNEQARAAFGVDVGSTFTLVQDPPSADFPFPAPAGSAQPIEQVMHVVGVMSGAGSSGPDSLISSGFYEKYHDQLVGAINAMVDLRAGPKDLEPFRRDVNRLMGRPVNVESADDLFGVRQTRNVSNVESTGLWLFALAVLVGAGALVGQALVRAVLAGAADMGTWRAVGVDRRLATRVMVAPVALVAVVAAVTTFVVAVLLSPRFPIALTRQFDLDIGFHADWLVLVPGALGVAAVVVATAWITAELWLRRDVRDNAAPRRPRWSAGLGLPPALLVGSRLATEAGRGNRAVPVRSAFIGAIAGVLGVVGCLTFRSGLSDTVGEPSRSGVVWNRVFGKAGVLTDDELATVAHDPAVAASLHATWARALLINGTGTSTFGVAPAQGDIALEMLAGSAPTQPDEIAFGPTTMDALGLHLGDRVTIGDAPGHRAVVVGRSLLPPSSHTDYDQAAWMTHDGLMATLGDVHDDSGDFFEDFLFLKWKPGADVAAAQDRLQAVLATNRGVYFTAPAQLPGAVRSLAALRVLPLALAIFFALLAVATVAHALVTTVRRRRADLAILRSVGFTKRDARLAIAWQATLLAIVGTVIGVPAGIIVGRLLWKQFAESFPVVYAPPLALLAVLLAAPAAVAIANALAVGPARRATRVRPAEVLRSE